MIDDAGKSPDFCLCKQGIGGDHKQQGQDGNFSHVGNFSSFKFSEFLAGTEVFRR
jgi:hypothetical protein